MAPEPSPPRRFRSDQLHPVALGSLAAMVIWEAVVTLGFFGGSGYEVIVMGVVAGFTLVVLTILLALRHIERHAEQRGEIPADDHPPRRLRDWLRCDMQIWQGRLRGSEAIILALLPVAAVAIGLTALLIVDHIVT